MLRAMPRFRVRLEAQDSDEFRETDLVADDKDAAKAWCEERERRSVAFRIGDDEAAELAKQRQADTHRPADEAPALLGRDKARLLTHEQTEPYKVASVKALDGED